MSIKTSTYNPGIAVSSERREHESVPGHAKHVCIHVIAGAAVSYDRPIPVPALGSCTHSTSGESRRALPSLALSWDRMAKAKKPTVVCWQCNKSFKGETACQNHASDKRHQWRSPAAPRATPLTASSNKSQAIQVPKPSDLRWICARCGGSFDADVSFQSHYKTMHKEPNKIYLVTSGQRATTFRCSACAAVFLIESQLETHRASKNTCNKCDPHYSGEKALQVHMENFHRPTVLDVSTVSPIFTGSQLTPTSHSGPSMKHSAQSMKAASQLLVSQSTSPKTSCAKERERAPQGRYWHIPSV
ncbi:hypothetical protein BC628DRAFT_374510 [Trametes gibbosa]|uniref:Zinc finger protein 221 n=1 Tax=Trametes gibbosa TaxID=160864 RepID=A0A6B9KI49_9APHY|nr:hypothetical protein BC628DRAFT_374510 [Trametes gibbosa]QHA24594.1 zinc finger protein 221 [Trametes gibbosa]